MFTKEQYDALVAEYQEEMKDDGFPYGDAPHDGWIFANWIVTKLLEARAQIKVQKMV